MCSTLASEVPLINTVPLSSTPPHFIFLIDFFTTFLTVFCLPVPFLPLPNQARRWAPRPLETKLGRRRNTAEEQKTVLNLRQHPFLSSDVFAQGILFIYLFICFRESKEKHSSARLMHRNSDGSVDANRIWNLKLEPAGPFVLRRSGATRRTTKTHRDTHSQCRRLGGGCLSHLLQSSK